MTLKIRNITASWLISAGLLGAAVVDRNSQVAQSPNNCELAVKTKPIAHARLKSLGDRVAASFTGINAIETLKVSANATVSAGNGYLSESVINDSGWLPEFRSKLLEALPSLWINIPRPCSDASIETYKEMLRSDPQVESVKERGPDPRIAQEPLPPVKRQAPNDPLFKDQYNLSCTGQQTDFSTPNESAVVCDPNSDIRVLVGPNPEGGYRTRVYNIDTGLDEPNPDFPSERINRRFSINLYGKNEKEKSNTLDINGHGTHTASTHSMRTNNGLFAAGISNADEQVIIVAFDISGYSKEEITIAAIWWVVNTMEISRREGQNIIGISNNSWTAFGEIPALREAVLAHVNAGITFVNAAGNAGQNNDKRYDNVTSWDILPASYSDEPDFWGKPLLVVAANDPKNQMPSFSNYGWRTTTTVAPGVSITALVPESGPLGGAGQKHRRLSGTSMSAPHVTGVAERLYKKEGPSAINKIFWRVPASSDWFPQFHGRAPGRLNAYEMWRHDNVFPEPVTDAKISDVNYNSATLTFTSPRDRAGDGSIRRVGAYFVRTATFPITRENFGSARPHLVLPPQEAGRLENIRLEGLSPETEQYVAVMVGDKGGNTNFFTLPPLKTKPAHAVFVQFTGYFDPTSWLKQAIDKLENLWNFDANGNLVYRIKGQKNYNTGADNGGIIWSPWKTVPEDGRLVLHSSRNTGFTIDELATGKRIFQGDYLFVTVQKESGQVEEIAKLSGNGGQFDAREFPLKKFEGQKVRIGLKFRATQEYAKLNLGGVVIYYFEIYGTRRDVASLPKVANATFDLATPSRLKNAPSWAADLKNWRADYICYPSCLSVTQKPDVNNPDAKWSKDWWASQLRGTDAAIAHRPLPPHKPHNPPPTNIPSVMRIWNATRDEGAVSAVTSDPIPIGASDFYQVEFRARLSYKLAVLILGFDKNNKETLAGFAEIKNTGGFEWADYAVPFATLASTRNMRIVFLVPAKAAEVTADIDDVTIEFLKKIFPETN